MLLTRATLLVVVMCMTSASAGMTSRRRDDVTRGGGGSVQVRECSDEDRVWSVAMCRHVVQYNVTGWPNLLGHRSLHHAVTQLRTFSPLVQYGCAGPHLPFFLCAVHVPLCTVKLADVIGPCRPVCEQVRRHCEPLLHSFGFTWPTTLDCDRFPPRNDHTHMCMEGPPLDNNNELNDDVNTAASLSRDDQQQVSSDCSLQYNETSCAQGGTSCVWVGRRWQLGVWIAAASTVCLLAALCTAVAAAVEQRRRARFKVYSWEEERVTVVMSACAGLYAVSVLVSVLFSPPGAVCRPAAPSSQCVLSFVVRYYFSSACTSWCLVMNVVPAVWSAADVERLTAWLHVCSWSVPAGLLLVLVVRQDVIELDAVLGLCRISRDAAVSHATLVLVPLIVFLLLTVTLIIVRLMMAGSRRRHDGLAVQQPCSLSAGLVTGTTVACVTATLIYEYTADNITPPPPAAAAAAAAAATVVYPPVISVVTAASIVCRSSLGCNRLMTRETDRDITITDHHRRHHHVHQQQQLMRRSIT